MSIDLDLIITAALGEHLITARLGMISPDWCPIECNRGSLPASRPGRVTWPVTVEPCGDVEPTIRAPLQAQPSHGMRILEPEALEMNFRDLVRHVVIVAIGVEQQIRRIEHPRRHAPRPPRVTIFGPSTKACAGRDAVTVGILMNRDLVFAA